MNPLEGGDYGVVAAPAAGGLGVGADRVVGQLQGGDGPAPGGPTLGGVAVGEQLQAAVVPAVRGVGIAQQGGDLLDDRSFAANRFSTDGPVHRLPPDVPARQPIGDGELPIQAVGPRHQLQPGEGEAIAPAQGLLAVALAGPAVLGGEHQHQGGAVAQDQQVGGGQEDAQVLAPAIHVGEHRAQAAGEADPAATAEHPGVGAQSIAEEAGKAGGIEALAVGGLRFPLSLGEEVLLATAAVRGGEQGPAVGSDQEGGA